MAPINIKDERSDLNLPPFFNEMLNRKWLGDKTKGGFYKKQKGPDGEQRFALDWKTLEYRRAAETEVPCARDGEDRSKTCPSGCRCCSRLRRTRPTSSSGTC